MKPTYEELEAKCAALAAENAGMKESRKNLAEFIHDELNTDYPLNMDIETPATDAFLAEVRAHGVEMFAAVLRRKGDDAFFDAIAEAQANAADQFAAQLRKGVQS
ncbi:hypothetical protein [Enterobacter hormaechei]|uniref:hypothetical protein n=1 Tax=Enterobacter hormaechei TaxID=158836 RepID=UPI003F43B1E0|nr:hypothetical protein [Enterobacter hormaechei]